MPSPEIPISRQIFTYITRLAIDTSFPITPLGFRSATACIIAPPPIGATFTQMASRVHVTDRSIIGAVRDIAVTVPHVGIGRVAPNPSHIVVGIATVVVIVQPREGVRFGGVWMYVGGIGRPGLTRQSESRFGYGPAIVGLEGRAAARIGGGGRVGRSAEKTSIGGVSSGTAGDTGGNGGGEERAQEGRGD